ncbi:MAG TPA: ACT domain-containing protein [Clostridiales bacterium]|nr:ACT domain-containing protein [Clostridiales bacterium]
MKVEQIAVFLENRKGRLCKFAQVLYDANINIKGMYIADTTDYGILRVITNDNEKAVKVLKENGFNTTVTELIGFKVSDKPGEMHKVLKLLNDHNVDISYLYSYSEIGSNQAAILIKVEDNEFVSKLLIDNKVEPFIEK